MATMEQPVITHETVLALRYAATHMRNRVDVEESKVKGRGIESCKDLVEISLAVRDLGFYSGYLKATGDLLELFQAMLERESKVTPPQ